MFMFFQTTAEPPTPIIPDVPEIAWLSAPIIFMGVIILSTFYLIKKIQKSAMEIQDAVSWILFNMLLLVFASYIAVLILHNNVNVLTKIANKIGFQSFETLILLIVTAWLWFKTFKLVSRYSNTKYKVTQLSQELAKLKWEVEHNNKRIVEMVNKDRMKEKENILSDTLTLEINDKLKFLEHDHSKDGRVTAKVQDFDKGSKTAVKKTTDKKPATKTTKK